MVLFLPSHLRDDGGFIASANVFDFAFLHRRLNEWRECLCGGLLQFLWVRLIFFHVHSDGCSDAPRARKAENHARTVFEQEADPLVCRDGMIHWIRVSELVRRGDSQITPFAAFRTGELIDQTCKKEQQRAEEKREMSPSNALQVRKQIALLFICFCLCLRFVNLPFMSAFALSESIFS